MRRGRLERVNGWPMYVNVLSMVVWWLQLWVTLMGPLAVLEECCTILFVVASRDHQLKNKRGYTAVRGSEAIQSMS